MFLLVPLCQARLGNGGLGVMYAMVTGELLMLIAAGTLLRKVIDRRTIADVCRSLFAGGATVLAVRQLPPLTPFLAIPICILIFGGLSLLIGAVKPSDLGMLLASFRRRSAAAVPMTADGPPPPPDGGQIDTSSERRQ